MFSSWTPAPGPLTARGKLAVLRVANGSVWWTPVRPVSETQMALAACLFAGQGRDPLFATVAVPSFVKLIRNSALSNDVLIEEVNEAVAKWPCLNSSLAREKNHHV